MNSICSIVITYNRKELLCKNIEAILNQTISTDILIFDNNSNDNTEEYLRKKQFLNKNNVWYNYSSVNLGRRGRIC